MSLFGFIKNFIRKKDQLQTVIEEVGDLPAAFAQMREVMEVLGNAGKEVERALTDGKLTKKEISRITTRQRDLLISLNGIMEEIDQAWDALKPFFSVKAES